MAKRDLTMWEVDEANKYGLSPDQYDELKSLLTERYRKNKWSESLEQAKTEAIKAAKPKIKEEVKAEILEELTSKFEESKAQEIRKKIEKEMAEASPTANQRRDAKEMARELELDCLATAHAASAEADTEQALLTSGNKHRSIVFWTLLLSYLPVLAYLNIGLQWQIWSVHFMAIAITQLVATIACGVNNSDWHEKHKNWRDHLRKYSANYINLANRAKEVRIVKINVANTKGEINSLIENISYEKTNLSREYSPSTKMLEQTKDHVRNTQISDMDLDKFIRSDGENIRVAPADPLDEAEDFDEKLSAQRRSA